MCDKKFYNLLEIYSLTSTQIWNFKRGRGAAGGGGGGKKIVRTSGKSWLPRMVREITLLTVKRPVSSIFGMLYPRFHF